MLVYRDNRKEQCAEVLKVELARAVDSVRAPDSATCLAALLGAADLECALADAGTQSAAAAAALSDALAEYWLSEGEGPGLAIDGRRVLELDTPRTLELGPPEGYAYYALHPRSYANLARECRLGSNLAAVIGIRSVGTSLSAVVRAALLRRGVSAQRLTVRPLGHPFERSLAFSQHERRFVEAHRSAPFLIVDEGPGLSGSTFLAVGEALTALGIPARQITFFCSNPVNDPASLLAEQAAARWARFRVLSAQPLVVCGAGSDFSGGQWRAAVYSMPEDWPESWVSRERFKFRTEAGTELWKFEGFPPYDAAIQKRAELLLRGGFGPAYGPADLGFIAYRWQPGAPASAAAASDGMLRRIASYAAFRVRAFAVEAASNAALEAMARQNVSEALGRELPEHFGLPLERPVVSDGRMAPHEWLIGGNGKPLKVDGVDHGEDHLFPGPTDIAWDLAGAAVEWQLDRRGKDALLDFYRSESGDDARSRFSSYLIAYCAFQLGCQEFAAHAADAAERVRLLRAGIRYRSALQEALQVG